MALISLCFKCTLIIQFSYDMVRKEFHLFLPSTTFYYSISRKFLVAPIELYHTLHHNIFSCITITDRETYKK